VIYAHIHPHMQADENVYNDVENVDK